MSQKSDLQAKQADVLEEMDALEKEAKDNNDGKMDSDALAEFTALDKQYEDLGDEITAAEATADISKKNAARKEAEINRKASEGRKSHANGPSGSITVHEPNFVDDPKNGFADHREFFASVIKSSETGRLDDERLKYLAVGSDEQSTVSDPYGGFFIPKGVAPGLLTRDPESDPTVGRTMAVPMGSPTVSFNARVDNNHNTSVSGGLRVYRRNELDTSASSRMEIEQVVLNATMLFGIAYASEELLARSPESFVALLDAGFSDEFSSKKFREKLFGTGAGQMEGIVNAPATITVDKEVGQAAATIVKENIDNMRARSWRYGRSIWIYNHNCLPQLKSLIQTIGTGGVAVPYFSTGLDGNATLDGLPAFASEHVETIGSLGDLILCDWSQYLEGTLSGQASADSTHVRFETHTRTFKFYEENDGKNWWRAPLTPDKGDTLSPCTILEAR